jgi:hypothetical protein
LRENFFLPLQPSSFNLHDAAILPFSIMFCSLLLSSFMMLSFSIFLQPSSYKLHVAVILPFSAAFFLQPS